MECKVNETLEIPCFVPYRKIFSQLMVTPKIEAAVLSAIYPFESFLDPVP